MATTVFFEKTIKDLVDKKNVVDMEFGRSSFYYGENLIYFKIDDKSFIVDEKTGREICEAMAHLGAYLAYDKS